MILSALDWTIIAGYLILSIIVGLWSSKKSSQDTRSFFLAGNNLPWWMLGISMVATTFSTDTPNLVTDLVRKDGVAGNWVWWAFLLTGMLSVFVYAKLWNRSGLLTDIQFYELRYGGRPAAFLRGFRALYLGLIFNSLVMGAVSLAAIKFGEIVLQIEGWQTLFIACSVTLLYSTLGGLKAVVVTDVIQFLLAMVGSVWAAIYVISLPQIGGIKNLINHPNVIEKISIFPDFSDPDIWVPLFFVPLAVQWWSTYYPGSEPGGGGYIAQRMFSAKNERNAIAATFLFNFSHYALRPWPWIIIALSSLIIFPEVGDIQNAFPGLSEDKLGDDVAYPAMLTLLPSGLLGIVSASLIAAFMSTMSTQLNLGASYLVNDFYHRFLRQDASQKELVFAGRVFTVMSITIGAGLGLTLQSAGQAFNLLLLVGAGTGAIYILRWFWWRINATTEIIAMISSVIIAGVLNFGNNGMEDWEKIIIGVVLTTIVWIIGTFLTKPEEEKVLVNFVKKINPGGPGWKKFSNGLQPKWSLPSDILKMFLGIFSAYSSLIGIGQIIYQNNLGYIFIVFSAIGMGFLFNLIEDD